MDALRLERHSLPRLDSASEGAAPPSPEGVAGQPLPSSGAEGARREHPDLPAFASPEVRSFYAGLLHAGPNPSESGVDVVLVKNANVQGSAAISDPRRATTPAGRAIDEVRAAYAGPYRVLGGSVSATPMFKMSHFLPSMTEHGKLASLVGALAVSVQSGQAPPADIVRVTQALLDRGKLPPPPGDVAARIKQMQWQYGIGIDCACYTRQCLVAVTGQTERALGIDRDLGLRDLARNPRFTRVRDIRDLEPGDVVTLDPKPPEQYGHNVIVRAAFALDAEARAELEGRNADVSTFLAGAGKVRVLRVDSSWGAGAKGSPEGGYRRDTWLYDEATRTWGFFVPGTNEFHTSPTGPADTDTFRGAFRAKDRA